MSRKRGAVTLGVVALLLSIFFWWPILAAYPNTQGGDGPPYYKTLEAARVSLVHYHELPLWNAYECGGLPLWDNPQSPVGAPLVLPMFLVGTTMAMLLWYVLHSAAGFVCMWLFARGELGLSRAATFVASAVWAFNGFHQQHYSGGHFTFVPFLYFPLAILLWRRAEKDVRMAVGLGVLVSWMFWEGGVYPLPHLLLILAAETLTRIWPVSRLRGILRAAAIVAAFGFLLSASRMLPVADQLRSHSRSLGPETDHLVWSTLKEMFLARSHGRFVEGQEYVWPEFGAYIGPILLALAIVGIFVGGLERIWIVALLAYSFSLMMGHEGRLFPWSILKGHIFPFKEMRVPSRFRCEVTLFLAALVGISLDRIPVLLRRWRLTRFPGVARGVLLAFALIGVGDMFGVGLTWFETCFQKPPAAAVVIPSPRLYFGGSDIVTMIDQPRQNRGRLQCWDEWGLYAGAPLWEGDVPQARSSPGVIQVANRTQNTFTIDVDTPKAAHILVNSSFDYGWQTNVGTLSEHRKELVLDVPPGKNHVVLRYWPRWMTAGIVLNVLGVLALAGFGWTIWRRRSTPEPRPPKASSSG